MALVHGACGITYFVHAFTPKFDEHALLDDPVMLKTVTEINREIHDLSSVLQSPTVSGLASVESASAESPIDILVRHANSSVTILAVEMRNVAGRGTFTVRGLPKRAVAEVLGERRTIVVQNGRFTDNFAAYGTHTYRIH
jgi:hypothetical protein